MLSNKLLHDIDEHIEDVKDLKLEAVRNEVNKVTVSIDKGVKWFETQAFDCKINPEDCGNAGKTVVIGDHPQLQSAFYRFIDLLRRRAALYLRECEPEQIKLI